MAIASYSPPKPEGKKKMCKYANGNEVLWVFAGTVVVLLGVAWLINLAWINTLPVFWPNRPYLSYWDTFLLLFCVDTAASYLKKIFHG